MTMPKKGTRKIVVDSEEYRWKLAFNHEESFEKHIRAAIELADSQGSTLVVYLIGLNVNYVDYDRDDPITPKDIEDFIRKALAAGWQPREKGPTFYLGRPSGSNRTYLNEILSLIPMTEINRHATRHDCNAISDVYLSAFPESERELIATLAIDLLNEETKPETISLVDEIDGEIVGHVAFSPVTMDFDKNWRGYILAPLAVKPGFQKQGIGSELINTGIDCLKESGVDVVFVYGDPAYYGRFGFEAETATNFKPPYELHFPFGWQAMLLKENTCPKDAVQMTCIEPLQNPALW